jgi:Kdo2-lipid IVA lauroyltransferase/acyltransferase
MQALPSGKRRHDSRIGRAEAFCYNPGHSQHATVMATQTPPPNSAFLSPRYWPTWLGIGCLCILAWLPFRLRIGVGTLLGKATWQLARERRYITAINIRLCFPELDPQEQAQLVRQSFIENSIGLIETACGWIRPPTHFRNLVELRGSEDVSAALAQGKGVLFLGAHYSTLDFSANLLSLFHPFGVTYRAHKNPLFDAFMLQGRIRNCNGVFDRKDVRGAFRHLKAGKILWYAPDQDYGPDQAVYAPWFGQIAITITAGSRFAAINNSPVFVVSHRRLSAEKKYILEFIRIQTPFPTKDDVQDAILINRMLEHEIRKAPAQYLWMHKRFKTQPGGKPQSPYIFIKTPLRKLDQNLHAVLLEGTSPIEGNVDRLLNPKGLQLWRFDGLAKGWTLRRHPVWQVDRISKHLRSIGILTITVDSIYLVAHVNSTFLLVHPPQGLVDTPEDREGVAAKFLHGLHESGCNFSPKPQAKQLAWRSDALALLDPLALRQRPGTACHADRHRDLLDLPVALGFTPEQRSAFQVAYLQLCRSGDRTALGLMLV